MTRMMEENWRVAMAPWEGGPPWLITRGAFSKGCGFREPHKSIKRSNPVGHGSTLHHKAYGSRCHETFNILATKSTKKQNKPIDEVFWEECFQQLTMDLPCEYLLVLEDAKAKSTFTSQSTLINDSLSSTESQQQAQANLPHDSMYQEHNHNNPGQPLAERLGGATGTYYQGLLLVVGQYYQDRHQHHPRSLIETIPHIADYFGLLMLWKQIRDKVQKHYQPSTTTQTGSSP
ncbi:hypothetical protein B0T17DRAFT_602339 [Bombardia bombarda]|uniref:Uncharacterized protein n=1 Tax=Bombardia bombarda TaxID=252184 RepID=A0AA39WH41_9PEZI|nr:hypothetical protein B0T17DRAFT_602339 [Bombardia bombarda]